MARARLTGRTVLGITGDDATGFLQNIVTCDMDGIDAKRAGYGALLTPQGKIICDFLVFQNPHGFYLDVRREAEKALSGRLQLYKLRANVDVTQESGHSVFVSWDDTSDDTGFADPRLADLGRRWIAPDGTLDGLADEEAWHARRIELAVPEGGVDFLFSEAFPHDAAMDWLNGIAFEKGCYVGQEVVSRMRHRGTARRRIVKVVGQANLPGPGTDILADGQAVGRLGSCTGTNGIGLVRLDRVDRARSAGAAVAAGPVAVSVEIPAWAGYGWPSAVAGK